MTTNVSGDIPSYDNLESLIKSIFQGSNDLVSAPSLREGIGGGGASSSEKVVVTKSDGQKINVFLKICRKNSIGAHYNEIFHTFDREFDFYATIYPALLKLQQESGLGSSLRLERFIPRIHGKGLVQDELCIVLEDFEAEGFLVTHKESFMTCNEIQLCFRALAIFHATSFACHFHKDYQWVIEHSKTLVDFIMVSQGEGLQVLKRFFETPTNKVIELMTAIIKEKQKGNPKLNDLFIPKAVDEKLLKSLQSQSYLELLRQTRAPQKHGKSNIVCHGDYHMWNVAFKDDDVNEADKLKFFDFQNVFYGSIGCDLQQFLSQTSTPKMRKSILEECLKVYSDAFITTCQGFPGLDVDLYSSIGSEENVTKEYKRCSMIGFLFASNFILPRFISDQTLYQSLCADMDSEKIVDILCKSVKDMQDVFQIYFDLFEEHRLLGTFDKIINA